MSTQQQGKKIVQLQVSNMEFPALYKWLLLAAQGIWSSGEGGIRSESRREGGKVKRRGKRAMTSKSSERPT